MAEKTLLFEHLSLSPDAPEAKDIPFVSGDTYLVDGEIRTWKGPTCNVKSPILMKGRDEPIVIGHYPMLDKATSLEVLDAAVRAYDSGRGEWATMHVTKRIDAMNKFLVGLRSKRDEIIRILMWEICKTAADSAKEVDRTIKYIEDTVAALKKKENESSTFQRDSGVMAQIRRAPYGVVLCVGPFNYPFNETYTTLIPALIMGNSVVMKLPRYGVLCHWPTFELFQQCFPKGVVNILSGSGRETMPHLMATGKVDIFAFIGTSKAADAVQQVHPKPHRLRVCLGLEAKNPAIVMADAKLDNAVKEILLGSLSYNGQRCTALKMILVHEDIREEFIKRFTAAVDGLRIGLPWEKDVAITPLPEENKPGYLHELLRDALDKGAKVMNANGGKWDRTWISPTVLFPVNSTMRLYHEEQFGPLVPIHSFKEDKEVFEYLASSPYGQQASIFGEDASKIGPMIDVLVNQVSRVNLNTQCQRGPDSMPFTGRKDSAYGTLSVEDALRVFSLRALVASKDGRPSSDLVNQILSTNASNFLRMDYLF